MRFSSRVLWFQMPAAAPLRSTAGRALLRQGCVTPGATGSGQWVSLCRAKGPRLGNVCHDCPRWAGTHSGCQWGATTRCQLPKVWCQWWLNWGLVTVGQGPVLDASLTQAEQSSRRPSQRRRGGRRPDDVHVAVGLNPLAHPHWQAGRPASPTSGFFPHTMS